MLRTRGPRQLAPRRGELTCRAVRPDRGPTRARTGHLRFARAALYQMSYRPMAGSEYRPRGGTPMVHPDSVHFLGAPVRRRSWQASSCQLGTRTRHICSRPGLPAGCLCHPLWNSQVVPVCVPTLGSRSVVAGVTGVEPATCGFGDRRSTKLSYTPIRETPPGPWCGWAALALLVALRSPARRVGLVLIAEERHQVGRALPAQRLALRVASGLPQHHGVLSSGLLRVALVVDGR